MIPLCELRQVSAISCVAVKEIHTSFHYIVGGKLTLTS